MAYSLVNLLYRDYEAQKSTVTFMGVAVTGANYVTQQGLESDLIAAVEGISVGLLKKQQRVSYELENAGEGAASPAARRELKFEVHFHYEGTTKTGRLEIPCPDLTLTSTTEKGKADLANPAVAAFVTAFQAYQKYTDDADVAHAAVVDEILIVGRNL